MNHHLLIPVAFFLGTGMLFAQGERRDMTAVTYEEIYDEPYSVNKLFVHFQPFYGELFATNVNAGFGLEATYYLEDKAHFKAMFRKTYSRKFYDFTRDLAEKTSDVDNRAEVFNYYELGATYHFRDFEQSSKTKMFLYKKSYKGNTWAARVPLNAEIPCKVRKIYGGRIGGIIWDSSVDLNRALAKQGLTNDDLKDAEGNGLPLTYSDVNGEHTLDVFSNISSLGGYVGGSITWIRNVAVNFDKFEEGIDDLILTVYGDILLAPALEIDDVVYTNGGDTRVYDVSPVKVRKFGARIGVEGKFNRTLSWAYGGEIGYRPSIEGRGFYALLKISLPVFGTNLNYKVESFGK
ncbi:MAG TPA: hypothetical protein VKZ86_10150 [Cyclobacteriaceae bacterium]|nr:hypothetical protein [Cyclobacteriaceae bacterium]